MSSSIQVPQDIQGATGHTELAVGYKGLNAGHTGP
jgi:hypothetical protein